MESQVTQWQHKQKEKGLCTSCLCPALPGRTQCEKHRLCQNDATKRYKEKHQDQGLCIWCSQPALPHRELCSLHGIKRLERERRRQGNPLGVPVRAYIKRGNREATP